jgi:hypothetical protein
MAFVLPRYDYGAGFKAQKCGLGLRQVSSLVTFLHDVYYGGRGYRVWTLPPTQGVSCERVLSMKRPPKLGKRGYGALTISQLFSTMSLVRKNPGGSRDPV